MNPIITGQWVCRKKLEILLFCLQSLKETATQCQAKLKSAGSPWPAGTVPAEGADRRVGRGSLGSYWCPASIHFQPPPQAGCGTTLSLVLPLTPPNDVRSLSLCPFHRYSQGGSQRLRRSSGFPLTTHSSKWQSQFRIPAVR